MPPKAARTPRHPDCRAARQAPPPGPAAARWTREPGRDQDRPHPTRPAARRLCGLGQRRAWRCFRRELPGGRAATQPEPWTPLARSLAQNRHCRRCRAGPGSRRGLTGSSSDLRLGCQCQYSRKNCNLQTGLSSVPAQTWAPSHLSWRPIRGPRPNRGSPHRLSSRPDCPCCLARARRERGRSAPSPLAQVVIPADAPMEGQSVGWASRSR
jgi:hypothetical protein